MITVKEAKEKLSAYLNGRVYKNFTSAIQSIFDNEDEDFLNIIQKINENINSIVTGFPSRWVSANTKNSGIQSIRQAIECPLIREKIIETFGINTFNEAIAKLVAKYKELDREASARLMQVAIQATETPPPSPVDNIYSSHSSHSSHSSVISSDENIEYGELLDMYNNSQNEVKLLKKQVEIFRSILQEISQKHTEYEILVSSTNKFMDLF